MLFKFETVKKCSKIELKVGKYTNHTDIISKLIKFYLLYFMFFESFFTLFDSENLDIISHYYYYLTRRAKKVYQGTTLNYFQSKCK